MSTMLLSFPGAALGLWITGYPFGMTSFIGIIGLVGIVVRNGIILIDYAFELVNKKVIRLKMRQLLPVKGVCVQYFNIYGCSHGCRPDDNQSISPMGSLGSCYLLWDDYRHGTHFVYTTGTLLGIIRK